MGRSVNLIDLTLPLLSLHILRHRVTIAFSDANYYYYIVVIRVDYYNLRHFEFNSVRNWLDLSPPRENGDARDA